MKILIYVSVILVLFCGILEPARSTAQDFSIPTQWKAEKVNVFENENPFVSIPAQIGDGLGGVAGGATGIALGLPVGTIASILTLNPFYFIIGPVYGNAFVGHIGRKIGSTVFGSPFYAITKAIEYISTAVDAEIANSGILQKYFRS